MIRLARLAAAEALLVAATALTALAVRVGALGAGEEAQEAGERPLRLVGRCRAVTTALMGDGLLECGRDLGHGGEHRTAEGTTWAGEPCGSEMPGSGLPYPPRCYRLAGHDGDHFSHAIHGREVARWPA